MSTYTAGGGSGMSSKADSSSGTKSSSGAMRAQGAVGISSVARNATSGTNGSTVTLATTSMRSSGTMASKTLGVQPPQGPSAELGQAQRTLSSKTKGASGALSTQAVGRPLPSVLPKLETAGSVGGGGRRAGAAGTSGTGGGSTTKPPQFVRVQVYALNGISDRSKVQVHADGTKTGGNERKSKAGIVDILNEATRATAEGYRHLTAQGLEPHPPHALYGPEPLALFDWFAEHEAKARTNRVPYIYKPTGRVSTRGQNPNLPTVLTEVASFPRAADENNAVYVEWRRLCVLRLKERYGANLVSVLEHTDEAHGHLHAIVARPDAKPIQAMHPGHNASALCEAEGGSPRDRKAAYIAALMEFQQGFFDDVAIPSGMARLSPSPKQRISRQQWVANKRAEEELAEAQAKVLAHDAAVKAKEAKVEELIAEGVQRSTGIRSAMQQAMEESLLARQRKIEEREAKQAKVLQAAAVAAQRARMMSDAIASMFTILATDHGFTKEQLAELGEKMKGASNTKGLRPA